MSFIHSSFDHDHGSAAPFLMDYRPKYGYTALKNNREQESNEGFKDYVMAYKGMNLYVSLHAQTSSARRIRERFHTVSMAFKDRSSGELLMELTAKTDFGFLAGKGAKGGILPVTKEGYKLAAEQEATGYKQAFRSVNIINTAQKDPKFRYNGEVLLKGLYEVWKTDFMCTISKRFEKFAVDILNPSTGIRDAKSGNLVWLGLGADEEFSIRNGLKRTIVFGDVKFGAKHCGFGPSFKGGYFFTDVYGKELRNGPGRDTVRQYIKPGFETQIAEKFGPSERWMLLYKERTLRSFESIGYGINPKIN